MLWARWSNIKAGPARAGVKKGAVMAQGWDWMVSYWICSAVNLRIHSWWADTFSSPLAGKEKCCSWCWSDQLLESLWAKLDSYSSELHNPDRNSSNNSPVKGVMIPPNYFITQFLSWFLCSPLMFWSSTLFGLFHPIYFLIEWSIIFLPPCQSFPCTFTACYFVH